MTALFSAGVGKFAAGGISSPVQAARERRAVNGSVDTSALLFPLGGSAVVLHSDLILSASSLAGKTSVLPQYTRQRTLLIEAVLVRRSLDTPRANIWLFRAEVMVSGDSVGWSFCLFTISKDISEGALALSFLVVPGHRAPVRGLPFSIPGRHGRTLPPVCGHEGWQLGAGLGQVPGPCPRGR